LPKVNKTKLIERKGVFYVSSILTDWGWISEEITQDYGEDLFVTIPIDDDIGGQNSFRIQIKATEHPKYDTQENLMYPFLMDHH
jgi:hypothetical protein